MSLASCWANHFITLPPKYTITVSLCFIFLRMGGALSIATLFFPVTNAIRLPRPPLLPSSSFFATSKFIIRYKLDYSQTSLSLLTRKVEMADASPSQHSSAPVPEEEFRKSLETQSIPQFCRGCRAVVFLVDGDTCCPECCPDCDKAHLGVGDTLIDEETITHVQLLLQACQLESPGEAHKHTREKWSPDPELRAKMDEVFERQAARKGNPEKATPGH
ncbi:hypothetical protein EJ08DRAFT_496863 [Tothia fuscella]|uniref:Uncharacterized protein n=1 Tax=Tothia fuscella TaxID=1048955 RepID=A0A9P4NZK3_9PEZI|nr:hypothetical protein EJ08DRAFT_496863 [Tothia fuscella]